MIKKRLKKLSQLGLLIGIRQVYFWAVNVYELYYQPYLTIKNIRDEGDKSQFFLLSLTAISPFILYLVLRVIYDLFKYGQVVMVTGNVFNVMLVVQGVLLLYLGYWTLMVLKKDK